MTLPSMRSNLVGNEFLQVGGGYGSTAEGTSPAGGLDIDNAGNLAMDGDATIDGTIEAGDAVDISGDLTVDGTLTTGSGEHTLTNAAGLVDGTKVKVPANAQGLSMQGLIGLWHFESTGTIPDYSGNNEHLTITNGADAVDVALVTGKYGRALFFSGDDKALTASTGIANAIGNTDFTISVWFKTDHITSNQYGNQCLWAWGSGAARAYVMLKNTDSGSLEIGYSSSPMYIASGLLDNTWHQVVYARELGGTNRIYLDGTEIHTFTDPSTNLQIASQFRFAHYNDSMSYPYKGAMDEATIWDRCLSATEVAVLFSNRTELHASLGDQYCNGHHYVEGTVNAAGFVDRSEIFTGDALGVLRAIKAEGQALNGFSKVDHNTLGPLLVERVEEYDEFINPLPFDEEAAPDRPRRMIRRKKQYRDLGKQIQVNSSALLALLERVEALESSH